MARKIPVSKGRWGLTQQQVVKLAESIDKQAAGASEKTLETFLDAFEKRVRSILNPDESSGVQRGSSPTTARAELAQLAEELDVPQLANNERLKFSLDVQEQVARGAGKYVSENENADEYPAWQLRRTYTVSIPRGYELKNGMVSENPEDSWESRWYAAAAESGDSDAARVLAETGRMIALKSSGIWQALGDGAGGYTDTLGNPFPPFAFNSGMDLEEIDKETCVEYGLLNPKEKGEGQEIDMAELFAEP